MSHFFLKSCQSELLEKWDNFAAIVIVQQWQYSRHFSTTLCSLRIPMSWLLISFHAYHHDLCSFVDIILNKLSQSLSWNSALSYQFYEAFKNVSKSIIVMCVVLSYPSFNCHRNKEFCLIIFKFLFEIFWNILFTSLFWKLDRTIFKVREIEIQRITSRGREIFSEFCQFLSEDYSTAEKNRQSILQNIRTSSKSSPMKEDNNAMPGFGMMTIFWA